MTYINQDGSFNHRNIMLAAHAEAKSRRAYYVAMGAGHHANFSYKALFATYLKGKYRTAHAVKANFTVVEGVAYAVQSPVGFNGQEGVRRSAW